MRRSIPLLALLLVALFPVAADAAPPANDVMAAAAPLDPGYTLTGTTIQIAPDGAGGWEDATVSDEDSTNVPSCLESPGYHSMWWLVQVPEASVLTVKLTSQSVRLYQPVVTIIGPVNTSATPTELACGLGQDDSRNDPSAMASGYVSPGAYLVRAASVQMAVNGQNDTGLPTISLMASLRDVTPPTIKVDIPTQLLGVGKKYKFNAQGTTDLGSHINPDFTKWEFHDRGKISGSVPEHSLIGEYAWKTPGLHQVTLTVVDFAGNTNTYTFFQFVHNFVPPKVGLGVFPPSPGASQVRLTVTHDVPVKLRIVVVQGGKLLRVLTSKLVKGHGKTIVHVRLRSKVKATGSVIVTGTASDSSSPPNTVPLLTCTVDPVRGGGTCG